MWGRLKSHQPVFSEARGRLTHRGLNARAILGEDGDSHEERGSDGGVHCAWKWMCVWVDVDR